MMPTRPRPPANRILETVADGTPDPAADQYVQDELANKEWARRNPDRLRRVTDNYYLSDGDPNSPFRERVSGQQVSVASDSPLARLAFRLGKLVALLMKPGPPPPPPETVKRPKPQPPIVSR